MNLNVHNKYLVITSSKTHEPGLFIQNLTIEETKA